MRRRPMTTELYNIAIKYQKQYIFLRDSKVSHYDALRILLITWKEEKLKESLGYFRTANSIDFMLKMKPWYYKNKEGNLLDDKQIQTKYFQI